MTVRGGFRTSMAALVAWLCLASVSSADAAFLTFTNESVFLASAGSVIVESFETSSGTNITSLSTPNFLLQHTGSNFSVLSSPSAFGTFATDGTRFLEENTTGTNQFKFSGFAGPLKAFGLNVTDYGDFGSQPLVMKINGTTQFTIASPPRPNGNVLYFGVVATGPDQITEVTLGSDDAIGIDKVSISLVPEPSTLVTQIVGSLGMLVCGLYRRRKVHA